MTPAAADRDEQPGLNEHSAIESVQRLYDGWARFYDWNPVLDLVRPARKRAIERMDLSPGDTVIDMGTGTGANLPYLREAVGPEGQVIGIDISPKMLLRARNRVDDEGWSNVTLIEADIRDPPLDAPVDGILSTFVVVMYADPGTLVDTWARQLNDGSLANLYAGPSNRWSAPAVNALLSLYLRIFEDGWNTAEAATGPMDVLAERGDRARAGLERIATTVNHDELVFGLAHLDVGHVSIGDAKVNR